MKIICDAAADIAKLCTDSAIAVEERLFITKISGSAPASLTALAESYSQLVPGNTGTKTLGRANLVGEYDHSLDLYSIEGIHPKELGYSLMANVILSKIEFI